MWGIALALALTYNTAKHNSFRFKPEVIKKVEELADTRRHLELTFRTLAAVNDECDAANATIARLTQRLAGREGECSTSST